MAVLESPPIGDDAFEQLCREHGVALLALCRRRLGPDGRADAEDACQEALLRAYRALPTLDPGRPVWPWLATIAANVCTDLHRRRRPEPAADVALIDDGVDLDEEIAVRYRRHVVGSAIGALPDRYRRQVWLADVAGWSYADIALHERTSVASVRSSLLRGRRELRARLHQLRDEGRIWSLPALVPLVRLRRRLGALGADGLAPTLPTIAHAAVAAVALAVTGTLAAPVTTPGVDVRSARPAAAVAAPLREAPAPVVAAVDRADRAAPSGRMLPLPGGGTPGIRAASEVDLDGRWRIVHAEVHFEHDVVPAGGGFSIEADCARSTTWCGRAEEALRRP